MLHPANLFEIITLHEGMQWPLFRSRHWQLVRSSLRQAAYRRTLRRAIRRAYAGFAQCYPEWAAAGFDEHFLTHEALSLLLRLGQDTKPTAANLAQSWAEQFVWFSEERRRSRIAALRPVASEFLTVLEADLYPDDYFQTDKPATDQDAAHLAELYRTIDQAG